MKVGILINIFFIALLSIFFFFLDKPPFVGYAWFLKPSLVIILTFLGGKLFLQVISFLVEQRIPEDKVHLVKKIITYSILAFLFVFLATYFLGGLGLAGGVSLGLFSAGLMFALQRPILCFVGWLVILTKRIYKEGDRIEIKGIKGDVADIGIFVTSLVEVGGWTGWEQATGRILNFPNAWVLEECVINYTQKFSWVWEELKIRIPFDSDWKKAENVLFKIAKEITEREIENYKKRLKKLRKDITLKMEYESLELEPKVFVELCESWIELALRYPCSLARRREVRSKVARKILEEFNKAKIPISFPSVRWTTKTVIPGG